MGTPGMPELLVILLIIVLLFGAKKIPDLAKGFGKGIKDFKSAVKDDEKDKENKEIASTDEKKETPVATNTTEVKKESV